MARRAAMLVIKRVGLAMGVVLLILTVGLLGSFVNHRVKLAQEADLFVPLGQMVTVNGHAISVYSEGRGEETLVFMAGSGTASPILDFTSLFSQLSEENEIAVVERLGYGFSDVADEPRDVDTVLEETREALGLAGLEPPYVVFPHSMGALTTIHWAQKYPDEVSGIVGLDPAVPSAYEHLGVPNEVMLSLLTLGARTGVTRFFPSVVDDSAAIATGSLTEHEKEIYRAVFFRRTQTGPMSEELRRVRENAEKLKALPPPHVKTLFFTSNGEGTGVNSQDWRKHQTDYLHGVKGSEQVFLEAGHYVHDLEYTVIASRSQEFIDDLGVPE